MKKKRIMVVEDEGITAMSLKSSLEDLGYIVTSTEFSGEDAVRKAATNNVDLVLMDIVLDGKMDGIEAAGIIHSHFNIPVVYLTAHSDEEMLKRIKQTEPFGYIVKPFDERELRIVVELAFYKYEMEEALRESESRYRTLFENATDAIYLIDPETQDIFDCNSMASKMTGYTNKELKTMKVYELHPEGEQAVVSSIFRKITESGSLSGIGEISQLTNNGKLVPVEINAATVRLAGRKYTLCIIRNITARKKAEEELKYERNKLVSILNSMEEGVYIVNKDYEIEFLNPVIRKEIVAVTDDKCYKSFHKRETVCSWCKIRDVLKGETVKWEWFSQKNGKTYDRFATPLVNPDGSISKLEILHDISRLKEIEDELQAKAITDELTGLFNRRGFFTLFEQHRRLADRTMRKMSLLYLDLDGLKAINDELGHQTGDQALLDTAEILRKAFRKSDVIARIGGDEFAVLLTEPSEADIDKVVLRHINSKLKTHKRRTPRNFELLLSIGITHYDPLHPCSIDELLTRADNLMYMDKQNHKHQIAYDIVYKKGKKRN